MAPTDKVLREYLSQQEPDQLEPLWEDKPLYLVDNWQTKEVADIKSQQWLD